MPKTNSLAARPRPNVLGMSVIVIVIIVLIGYVFFALSRPFPTLAASNLKLTPAQATTSAIAWPGYGQSSVGVLGYGVLTSTPSQTPHAIASIAKTMLALMVVKQKPLKVGDQGPSLTLTDADVKFYTDDVAQNGSVVPVQTGETLSEYQLLQALLLPSGDNIAESLATWTFGSVAAYDTQANAYAQTLGLTQTHFDDASGLSPKTVSTAHDLVLLGQAVMSNPVLAQIVGQNEVTLPIAGKMTNYNSLLGQQGIVGIKTGNTDEAGGCFLFATQQTINGKNTTIIGAILGATDRATVLNDTLTFIQNNKTNFSSDTAVKAGTVIGTYNLPWGGKVNAVAKTDATLIVTGGGQVATKVSLPDVSSTKTKGDQVTTLTAEVGESTVSVPVVLDSNISKPSIFWRLFHPTT
jgi:D-alanyl-D-alanine carboxypeptidase (penicillin-binding protein 5/6)